MRCGQPTSVETLVAWWTGELAADDESVVEEHFFSCEECAASSEKLAKLAHALRDVVPPVISRAHRDRLVGAGKRILFTPCDADACATARFAPELDLMVHALRGDLARAESVDVEILSPEGAVWVALEHVPFDRVAGEVLVACQRHYERIFGVEDAIFRVHAIEAGARRRVGDYVVHHIWS